MDAWRTAITDSDETHLWIRGYDVTSLMTGASFTDTIFLLHQGRLPSKDERRLLDAILIAVSDHGPGSPSAAAARIVASGNRQSLEAAIGAGVLAIGDAHGGAGYACMQVIAAGLDLARQKALTIPAAAEYVVAEAVAKGMRLPGMGHRVHTHDPRTDILFGMAREGGLARDGIAFMEALEQAASAKIKPLPINVDGALAAVLYDLGFPPPLARLFFIIGRVAGLTAQVMEEHTREKPMRIRIPVTYDGPPPRSDG
jgi:citrate synthase